MKIMQRTLLAFAIGLIGAASLQRLDFAEALDRAGKTAEARSTPDLNLGDCLRSEKPKDWPAPYLAICRDLTLETAPPSRPHSKPDTAKPDARLNAVVPAPARTKPASEIRAPIVPLPKPAAHVATRNADPVVRIAAQANKPVTVTPALPADTCIIDEQGRTARHVNGTAHTYAPTPAQQKSVSRRQSGTALLVEAACNVKSPMAGRIAYAGDFKGYRGVVILRLTSGRQLIVAGFDHLNVTRGQTIARGAFLGSTTLVPAPALASAYRDASAQRTARSLLYFDMRNAQGDSQTVVWLPQSARISELAAK